MAECSADRASSISSSITEAQADEEHEKNGAMNSAEGSFVKLKSPEDLEIGDDVETAELLPAEHEKPPQTKPDPSVRSAFVWMVVNTLATIGIVSSSVSKFHQNVLEGKLTRCCSRSSRTKQSFRTQP
jgi:solute carrier family 35 protein E3